MKKFIISIDYPRGRNYVSGERLEMLGFLSRGLLLSADIKDAEIFESEDDARKFMSRYSFPDNAIVTYLEVTELPLLNKEDK